MELGLSTNLIRVLTFRYMHIPVNEPFLRIEEGGLRHI